MDIEILNNTETIPCDIEMPSSGLNQEKCDEFVNTLKESNFLNRITEKTSLKYLEPSLKVVYSDEADFKGLDTVFVDYNRGSRAVSSATHESFHLMLRQIKWTENPVVSNMVKKYPELVNSSDHGVAYKMEQMFAYLLQNDIYQEIARDMNFDASKYYWRKEFIIKDFLPYEFHTPFLSKLVLAIIDVWYSPNRSKNIFEMVKEVDERLGCM